MLTAINNKNNPFSSIFVDNEKNIVFDIQNTNTKLENKRTMKKFDKKMIRNEIRNRRSSLDTKNMKFIYRARRNWTNKLQTERTN